MWADAIELNETTGWAELNDHGWDAVKGWVAGPLNLGRRPQEDIAHRIQVEGQRGPASTDRDSETPDEVVNAHLRSARISERPPGYSWYIRAPRQWPADRDFLAAIDYEVQGSDLVREPGGVTPTQLPAVFRDVLTDLYTRWD